MGIDPDIAKWVLEFLLRQPLNHGTLKSLLRVLPLRDDDPNLKKLLLLKKVESDAARDLISEETLESLEQLGELEFRKGKENISDAMRRAYCAVAVEATVKALANEDVGDDLSRFRYFEMVKRVWRGRMGRMKEMMGEGGLGSEELWAWKDEVEAAVWDDNVHDVVAKKSLEVNAVEAVDTYVKKEREMMGPSFLEVAAARLKNDELMQRMKLGVGSVAGRVSEKEECSHDGLIEDDRHGSNKEIHKGKIHLRNKVVGLRHCGGSASGKSRRTKIVDSTETTAPSCPNYDLQHSAEVHRVREALESSSLELKAAVKDPLPEALQYAKAISSEARERKRHRPVEDNCVEVQPISHDGGREKGVCDPLKENCVEANTANGNGVDRDISHNASNVRKPSLMERNATAHTYEWDDSIDRSQDDSSDHRRRLLLPSPIVFNPSPLKRQVSTNLNRRRKPKKWSLFEEDALRAGVQKYGKGSWKVILTAYHDEFEDRTEIDLKDKWRNMTRHGGV
ncbi:uncharacterized protein LOC127252129 isoform X2 [Andrographis paniculata]|uniref:uncharacterized protein LOC127252129 isoform X2 n=1 Tax=Andrographis paniculata TaxID=175694 RepID=UPI0021E9007C|nr:uncharacterized protein LOC127252129 isoform X2 [Andrographis paniculata]